ncbi:dienelactone hydrolase family protein [Umezawaea sp. Da 62-37]|uniref:alpha/beta hydrolase family protein n=1 Tax=Umezawaea sp. Da 62-37 TaxID=3075927 RepID=UPI0028F6E735|nr:dienelactone hydrolase family protein [Umezawaea sp. Da 62-37]WNV87063.1 dienelactone hydrolase family protein [Umezawaea sp. Da 62-37]
MFRTALVLLGVMACLTGPPPVAARGAMPDCAAFAVLGDARSVGGATWTYRSTDEGVRYALEGVLFTPEGAGPHPAVVISHGRNGDAGTYSARIARTVVGWGVVAIATNYTHAPDAVDRGNAPDGPDGASQANVERAEKTRQLLTCVGVVDMARVAAHGNSMGAFVTIRLLGTHPGVFRAASHTSGGIGPTDPLLAARITTPYQVHHGDADTVVPLSWDQALARILTDSGTPNALHVHAGRGHPDLAHDPLVLSQVREWYRAHGVLRD